MHLNVRAAGSASTSRGRADDLLRICWDSAGITVSAVRGGHGRMVHNNRRTVHREMEKAMSYAEAETLSYIIHIIKSEKKTGVKR